MSDHLTTDPNDPRLGHGVDTGPVPQHGTYLVLSEEERAKGFVRPLRRAYLHVGPPGPTHPLRDLTGDQQTRYLEYAYVKYEDYGGTEGSVVGRFWTQAQLDKVGKGCGTETRMGLVLSETTARDPHFYGATYCVGCSMHLPVEEFTWVEDGQRLGT